MSWKKNVLGYLTWFLYTLMTGVLLIGAVGTLCREAGLSAGLGYVASAASAAVSGAAVFGVRRISPRLLAWKEKGAGLFFVLEAAAVLAFLAAGVLLRARQIGDVQPSSVYYDMAEVVAGRKMPQIVHGAVHFYVQLLHLLFTMVGNQYMAGIWLQIVLQTAAFLGLFFVLRRLYGGVAALTVFGFGMLGPFMRGSCMVLSPEILYFCIFAAAFACTVRISRGKLNPVAFLFTGILSAFCIYVDVAGVLVLLLACWTVFGRRDTETGRGRRAAALGLCLAGALLGLMACVSVDALVSGKTLQGVVRAWVLLYEPGKFTLPFAVAGQSSLLESLILAVMLALGIFSFWCDRQEERISYYTAAVCLVIAAACAGIPAEEMPGFYYLYLYCAVLAGLGVSSMFAGRRAEAGQEARETVKEERQEENCPETENPEEGGESSQRESSGDKQIKYLENPLPLPRKHVKREMDYLLQAVPENDDFDHPVCQDDDFDI